MSKDNTMGNVAIGLAVAVLGFVVYKSFFGSSAVTYTGTAPTAKQTTAAANPGAVAASIAASASNAISSLFGTSSSTPGALNTYVPVVGTDQTYASASYNPDAISADIGNDTLASMASSGESDLNSWGFSL